MFQRHATLAADIQRRPRHNHHGRRGPQRLRPQRYGRRRYALNCPNSGHATRITDATQVKLRNSSNKGSAHKTGDGSDRRKWICEIQRIDYSDGATADQILGFGAELFWNFGEFGVLFGYVLLGLWARHLDERSRRSDDPLATYTYTYTYMGLWVALTIVNSLSIVSQEQYETQPVEDNITNCLGTRLTAS